MKDGRDLGRGPGGRAAQQPGEPGQWGSRAAARGRVWELWLDCPAAAPFHLSQGEGLPHSKGAHFRTDRPSKVSLRPPWGKHVTSRLGTPRTWGEGGKGKALGIALQVGAHMDRVLWRMEFAQVLRT